MNYTTSDLFVSYTYGSDINNIWTTREEAETENVTNNDIFELMSNKLTPNVFNKRPYKVLSLYDAIEEIRDYVRDDERLRNHETSEY